MRGIPEFNFPLFFQAQHYLVGEGWHVHNPAAHDLNTGTVSVDDPGYDEGDIEGLPRFNLEKALRWDLARITESDAVVLLPGWEQSSGVATELAAAKACGLEVLYYCPGDRLRARYLYGGPEWEARALRVMQNSLPPGQEEDILWSSTWTDGYAPGEVRFTDPDTGGEKGSKLARFDLIPPDALWELAELYGAGSEKYEDRNWEKGYPWSLSIAALGRHLAQFMDREDWDGETDSRHIIAVTWHALALATFSIRGLGTDDRSKVRGDD